MFISSVRGCNSMDAEAAAVGLTLDVYGTPCTTLENYASLAWAYGARHAASGTAPHSRLGLMMWVPDTLKAIVSDFYMTAFNRCDKKCDGR